MIYAGFAPGMSVFYTEIRQVLFLINVNFAYCEKHQKSLPYAVLMETMIPLITGIEVGLSILLSICILLQHRASGLSATFGGAGATYVQRRGAEKLLFQVTIWTSVLFFGLAVVLLVIS